MIISVKRNFLELKNINDLIKKDKPEDNYSVEKIKPDFQLNKFFYKQTWLVLFNYCWWYC